MALIISNIVIINCVFRGPPGPPEDVIVEHVSSTTSQLSWRPGADNNSPIQMFAVQARTPFSVGWQAVSTGKWHECSVSRMMPQHAAHLLDRFVSRVYPAPCHPLTGPPPVSVPETLGGKTRNATVVGLSPWVEYEFRVVAGNSVGIGEPSEASEPLRTKASGKQSVASGSTGDCMHGSEANRGSHGVFGLKPEATNQRLTSCLRLTDVLVARGRRAPAFSQERLHVTC